MGEHENDTDAIYSEGSTLEEVKRIYHETVDITDDPMSSMISSESLDADTEDLCLTDVILSTDIDTDDDTNDEVLIVVEEEELIDVIPIMTLVVGLLPIFADAITMSLLLPLLPGLLEEYFGIKDNSFHVAMVDSIVFAGKFFSSMWMGFISDKIGRKQLQLLSITALFCTTLLVAFSPVFWLVVVGRGVLSAANATVALGRGYLADILPKYSNRVNKFAWGLTGSMYQIGRVFGSLSTGILLNVTIFGDQFLPPLLALLILQTIVFIVVSIFFKDEERRSIITKGGSLIDSFKYVFTHKEIMLVFLPGLFSTAGNGATLVLMVLYGNGPLGLSASGTSFFVALFAAIATVYQLLVFRRIHWQYRTIYRVGLLSFIAFCIIYPLCYYVRDHKYLPLILIFPATLGGIGFIHNVPIAVGMLSMVARGSQGFVQGSTNSIRAVARGLIGSFAVGYIYSEFESVAAFIYVGLLYLIPFCISFYLPDTVEDGMVKQTYESDFESEEEQK
ncbi:hypothetical protein PCE1_004461 [Barthelona sp. PCE]